ncbi:MAG: VWA domain-containing protein [Chloroflexia bacterium]|nr:VWA domain-containing protein [Chloroflexia bacterium]
MHAKIVRTILLLVALLLLATLPLQAAPTAQAPQTVRIDQVDTSAFPQITLYLSVLDAAGTPVEGLDSADFEIQEGGQPVRVTDFAGLGQSRPVDIVFVLDTTGSMGNYIEGIKDTAIAFAQTLENRNRDYRLALVTFGDAVRQSYSFTDRVDQFSEWMESQIADGGDDNPENPLAAMQEAAGFSFRSSAQRVFILITDAPAHQYGDPDDGGIVFDDPSLTPEQTVQQLVADGISVYTVTGNDAEYLQLVGGTGGYTYSIYEDFVDIVDRLGQAIANQYRLTYRTPDPSPDGRRRAVQAALGGTTGQADYDAPSTLRPGTGTVQFYSALRTPLDISTELAVVGTNLSLAALLALLFGLTSTVFNDTLNEHGSEMAAGWLGRFLRWLSKRLQPLNRLFGSMARGRRTLRYVQVALFLVLTALIGCYLEPGFNPFSLPGLGLFFSMLLSIGLVNLAYEGSQVWTARRFQLDAFLQLHLTGILAAAACVFFSRLVGFVPGYLYGVPGGYALGSAVALSRRREATIAGSGLLAAGLLALLSWGLTVPLMYWQGTLGLSGFSGTLRGLLGGVQSLLLTLFFVGLEVVFFELFPMGPTNGTTLFKWNKALWALVFVPVSFIALHTLFTPESAYLETVRNQNLLLLLALLALYSLLTVLLWYWFELRGRKETAPVCPACGSENRPESRFCASCGGALVAPRRSPQGLALVIILAGLWLVLVLAVILGILGVG